MVISIAAIPRTSLLSSSATSLESLRVAKLHHSKQYAKIWASGAYRWATQFYGHTYSASVRSEYGVLRKTGSLIAENMFGLETRVDD